jgi:hypothetical protein
MPSSAEYWHMGETTTRLASCSSRSLNGVNMGGGGAAAGGEGTPAAWKARSANQPSTRAVNAGSRSFKFSCVTRRLRVSSVNANWIGSSVM